jgi:hypothetical protein
VYNVVDSIEVENRRYKSDIGPRSDASVDEATAPAADNVLVNHFSSQQRAMGANYSAFLKATGIEIRSETAIELIECSRATPRRKIDKTGQARWSTSLKANAPLVRYRAERVPGDTAELSMRIIMENASALGGKKSDWDKCHVNSSGKQRPDQLSTKRQYPG